LVVGAPEDVNVIQAPSPSWYILFIGFAIITVSSAMNVITPPNEQVVPVNNLFAILFFLISVVICGIGLIGEYLGRLSLNMNPLPRFEIKELHGFKTEATWGSVQSPKKPSDKPKSSRSRKITQPS
jgi:hypothetical protein